MPDPIIDPATIVAASKPVSVGRRLPGSAESGRGLFAVGVSGQLRRE